MNLLVKCDYDGLVELSGGVRLTAEEIRRSIEEYGCHVIDLPPSQYDVLNVVEIKRAVLPSWSVVAPIWTMEEGRSDLDLELTVTLVRGRVVIELDNLHVR